MTSKLPQPRDIIADFDSQRQRIFKKAAEKYRNGSSTEEISQEFELPKTSVREGKLKSVPTFDETIRIIAEEEMPP